MNKFVKNLFSTGAVTILSQLLTFAISAYLARVLSENDFGMINTIQAILVYFTMITLFGFQTCGIKEVASNRKNSNEVVGNITFIRLLVALGCFIVCIAVAILEAKIKGDMFKVLLIIYGISIFLTAFNINFYFSGIYDMQYNAVYNFIRSVVPFILTILFVKSSKDLVLVPIFYVVGLFIAVLYQIIIYYMKGNRFTINKKGIRNTVIIGIPFLLSGILSMINCNVDSIMISSFRGYEEVALYSAGYKIIFFLTNVTAIIFTPIFPLLSDLYNRDKKALKNLVDGTSKVIIMIAMPVMIGGILLSKDILVLLFGKEYYAGGSISFSILLVYIFILFMRELYAYSLNAWNHEKIYLKIIAISASVNFIFNLILIPKFGINAAAMVTLCSELITFFAMRLIFKREIGHSYIKYIAKALIPTIVMAIVVCTLKYVGINIIANIAISAVVYLILIFITKYITKTDINLVLKI